VVGVLLLGISLVMLYKHKGHKEEKVGDMYMESRQSKDSKMRLEK